jgi:plastocyanin
VTRRSIVGLVIGIAFSAWALDAGGAFPQRGARVVIQSMQFRPASVTIKAGESVAWVNSDDRDHKIVGDGDSFASGNLSSGQSFTQRFEKPGRFGYSCAYHPRMKGTVVVE